MKIGETRLYRLIPRQESPERDKALFGVTVTRYRRPRALQGDYAGNRYQAPFTFAALRVGASGVAVISLHNIPATAAALTPSSQTLHIGRQRTAGSPWPYTLAIDAQVDVRR